MTIQVGYSDFRVVFTFRIQKQSNVLQVSRDFSIVFPIR